MKKRLSKLIVFVATFLIFLSNSANSVLADTLSDSFANTDKINIGSSSYYSVTGGNASLSFNNFGDGADGPLTVSTNKNINTDLISAGRPVADGINYTVGATTNSMGANYVVTSTPMLIFNSTNVAAANAYSYWKTFANSTVLATGDTFEYDVLLATNTPLTGGLDIYFTDGTYARNIGWVDQNGLSCNQADLRPYAYTPQWWFHRKCTIPAGMNGKTISYIDLVNENDTATATQTYFGNFSIKNSSGAAKSFVWSSGTPGFNIADPNTPKSNAGNTGDVVYNGLTYGGPTALGLAAGDDILLINLRGSPSYNANVGNYELLTVLQVNYSVVYFTANIQKSYGTTSNADLTGQSTMIQRIPNYTNVTVNSGINLTASAFNGQIGGVVAFRATGTVTVTGNIHTNALGSGGGTGATAGGWARAGASISTLSDAMYGAGGGQTIYAGWYHGQNGEFSGGGGGGDHYSGGLIGGGGAGTATAGAGGGAGGGGAWCNSSSWGRGGGGGGGGYGSGGGGGRTRDAGTGWGADGNTSASGAGGTAFRSTQDPTGGGGGGGAGNYGEQTLAKMFLGSGGGGGGGGNNCSVETLGSNGGTGAGIILIAADTISVGGTITTTGGASPSTAEAGAGCGGGGSGGSIRIISASATLGASKVTATGGASGGVCNAPGGTGGNGRIAVYAVSTPGGVTTSPAAYTSNVLPPTDQYSTTGTIVSTNLLSPVTDTVNSIDFFIYNLSSKPPYTDATIQFSQYGSTWYNSAGQLGGTDTLTTGPNNSINIHGLGWTGANFIYKVVFTSNASDTPVLADVMVDFSPSGSCAPPIGGNLTLTKNCSFSNMRDGVDDGNLTIPIYKTLTINAGQTVGWNEGKSITIATGGSIALAAGAGNAVDDIVGSNHGTASGATLVAGKYDNGRSLNGSSNYIEAPNTPSLQLSTTFTLEAWINRTADSGGYERILSKSATDGYDYWMQIQPTDVLDCGVNKDGTNTYYRDTTATIPTGQWVHVACSYDSTSGWNMYINGALDNGTAVGTLGAARTSNRNLEIGRLGAGAVWYYGFNGIFDEVRMYNYVRTLAQVTEDMNNTTITGNAPVALWNMEDRAKLQQSYLWVPDANDDFMIDTTLADQVYKSSQPTGFIRRKDAKGFMRGTGSDTSIIINGNTNLNTWDHDGGSCPDAVNYSVATYGLNTPTQAVLTTTPLAGCLVAGDEVLLINLQGTTTNITNVGNYESLWVSSVSSNTVNFATTKTKYYGNGASDDTNLGTATTNQRVMLQRVPNYGDVTVNSGALTPSAWDGVKGGVIYFRATGTVSVAAGGTINANTLGYRGGPASTAAYAGGQGGESYCSYGGANASWGAGGAGAGGGGGGCDQACGNNGGAGYCGGGGAGHNTGLGGAGSASSGGAGGAGSTGGATGAGAGYGSPGIGGGDSGFNGGTDISANGGDGNSYYHWGNNGGAGGTYGVQNLSKLYLGSGGGTGGICSSSYPSMTAGYGGGIVVVNAATITVTGGIQSNATPQVTGSNCSGSCSVGGSGGGSGGSVRLMGGTITLGSNLVTAAAGLGGWGCQNAGGYTNTLFRGGDGGAGRIAIWYTGAVPTGSTNPAYQPAQ